MKKKLTLLYALLLALTLILSGCQGDAGPAGTPGANGTTGVTGPQGGTGTAGSNGTTGGLPNDPFQVGNFHGFATSSLAKITDITSANYTKAIVNGPNSSVNPCVKINTVTINGSGNLVVDFEVKKTVGADRICGTADDGTYTGSILDATIGGSILTPSFIFAQLRPGDSAGDASYWVNYVNGTVTKATGVGTTTAGTTANQPTSESHTNSVTARKGTLVDHASDATPQPQTYTYTTKAVVTDPIVIPVTSLTNLKSGTFGYSNNVIRVGIQMSGANSATAYRPGAANNATYDLVPAGAPVTTREIVDVQNCNDGCHTTLALHGGGRLDTKLCVLCHNPTNGDPESGNVLDFKVFIHKIHSAKYLPSVNFDFAGEYGGSYKTTPDSAVKGTPYTIWGFGSTKFDYSEVLFPANPANCTMCHKNPPGKLLADVDNYKTKPTKEACGSCHDGINFADGTGTRMWFPDSKITPRPTSLADRQNGHIGGIRANGECSGCHTSSGSQAVPDADPAPIPAIHGDFTNGWDKVKTDYTIDLTMSAPANGTHYVSGEKPIVTIVLKDPATGTPIDHTKITDNKANSVFGNGTTTGPLYGLSSATGVRIAGALNLYVSGPRALRKPALTTASANKGFFSLTNNIYGNASNDLRIRTGTNAALEDDYQLVNGVPTLTKLTGVISRVDAAKIQYQLSDVAGLTSGTYVAMVHATNRTAAPGVIPKAMSLALKTFQVGTATEEMRVAFGCPDCHSTTMWHDNAVNGVPGNHPAKFDPDYCGNCHDYEAQAVAYTTGAAGTTTANTTYKISLDSTGNEVFTPAILSAGSGQLWKTGGNNMGFSSAPIARRVHGVHFARKATNATGTSVKALGLNYPYELYNGHNVSIVFPQDIKNCEKCHPAATTSGTWKTKPGRVACLACHDSDATYAHAVLNTVDATPTIAAAAAATTTPTSGPYNGDEIESCPVCHTPKQ